MMHLIRAIMIRFAYPSKIDTKMKERGRKRKIEIERDRKRSNLRYVKASKGKKKSE